MKLLLCLTIFMISLGMFIAAPSTSDDPDENSTEVQNSLSYFRSSPCEP